MTMRVCLDAVVLRSVISFILYRVNHQLADLGWVEFDLDVTTILRSCSTRSAKLSSSQAEPTRQTVE